MASDETFTHSDTLPESDKTNFDDAWFADSKHWEDVNADLDVHYPPQTPELDVENEYLKVTSMIHDFVQKRDRDGNFELYVSLSGDGKNLLGLGQFLAGDLFKKLSAGTLTREQLDELLKEGLDIIKAYGHPRRHDPEHAVFLGDDKFDWRDSTERAAGESLD